jgi:hypothetical protein
VPTAETTQNLTSRPGAEFLDSLSSAPDSLRSVSPPVQTTYQALRYEETRVSERQERANGDLDRLKYIPLGKSDGGWYLSIGSEARIRYEYFEFWRVAAG